MTTDLRAHIGFERLLAYWFGESDDAETQAIDEHLMRCDACGRELDQLAATAQAVRDAFLAGEVGAAVSPAFVAALAQRGIRVREYRVPHNGSIACTVAPEDQVLVSRLEAPLQGVRRLDVVSALPDAAEHLQDVPFDPSSGEVVLAVRAARIRRLPAHEAIVRLLAIDEQGSREIGRYTFRHRPWS